jgi:hypothetical protein
MSFEFTFRRLLADLRYDMAKLEVDLDEHTRLYTGQDKEVLGRLLEAKVAVAQYKVADMERRLATSLQHGRQMP